jgi:hypothetical protein
MFSKTIDESREPNFVLQQGGDVVKQDSLLGEIGNLAD